MERDTVSSRLQQHLGPEFVSLRPGQNGEDVYYLPVENARSLANDIFGHGNWSYEQRWTKIVDEHTERPDAPQFREEDRIDSQDMMLADPNSRPKTLYSCSVVVCVRVTLEDGAFREDVGCSHGEGEYAYVVQRSAGRIAASDALKRALRQFGNALGNCIYNKDVTAAYEHMSL